MVNILTNNYIDLKRNINNFCKNISLYEKNNNFITLDISHKFEISEINNESLINNKISKNVDNKFIFCSNYLLKNLKDYKSNVFNLNIDESV